MAATHQTLNLNECFLQWLTELREATRSKMRFNFDKAIKSLKKYPVPLRNCSELLVWFFSFSPNLIIKHLESFGPFLVDKLEARLRAYCLEIGLDFEAADLGRMQPHLDQDGQPKKKRKKTNRPYIPAFQSGPYALLMAFAEAERVNMAVELFFFFCDI
jgi:crossover junction endonuclease MUS81